MTTGIALILLAVALALLVSAGIVSPRHRRVDPSGGSSGASEGLESELLRRPIRSRYSAE